jgi:WhiB family redox-sensing transcriptional regulator
VYADLSWSAEGACRSTEPDLFFPIGRTNGLSPQAQQAKRICGACGVRAACLDYALAAPSLTGIWGGTDEQERRALLRAARR